MMRRNVVRAVLGTAGLLAVLGAGACGGGEQRQAGRVAAESSGCAALQQRITAGQAVDVAAAERCDQTQFGQSENERQAARAKGEKPAMQVSAICRAVDAQAAKGDSTLTSASGSCVLLNDAAFEQVREAGKFLIRHARIERVG